MEPHSHYLGPPSLGAEKDATDEGACFQCRQETSIGKHPGLIRARSNEQNLNSRIHYGFE